MAMKLSSFLQLRCNTSLYRRMTWNGIFAYLYILSGFYFLLNRRERLSIESSVRQVLQQGESGLDVEEEVKKVFRGIVCHYYEKLFNAYAEVPIWKNFILGAVHSPSFNHLSKALSAGRGVLYVTGHYGGIEYMPVFLAMRGCPISVVASFSTPELKQALERRTRGLGLRIIDAAEEGNVARAIFRELKDNRLVFFECDEIDKWKPARDEQMVFLGRSIFVDRTITLLAKRSGAAVMFGLLHRLSLERYFMFLEPYEELTQDVHPLDKNSPGKVLLKRLEAYVYTNPEQWYQWKEYPKLGSAGLI